MILCRFGTLCIRTVPYLFVIAVSLVRTRFLTWHVNFCELVRYNENFLDIVVIDRPGMNVRSS